MQRRGVYAMLCYAMIILVCVDLTVILIEGDISRYELSEKFAMIVKSVTLHDCFVSPLHYFHNVVSFIF